jgi:hypothetical protein
VSTAFANLDVGLPGGGRHPDSARATVNVETGDPQVVRQTYAFVGFAGKLSHNLGERGRRVTWRLTIDAVDLATLIAIEQEMDAAKRAGGGQLTNSKGRTFQRAVLTGVREQGQYETILSGELEGWVTQDYVLEFEVLTAD